MSDGWTDAQVARLKVLWAAGASHSEVAADLGCGFTRSAIAGKIARLGINRGKRVTVARESTAASAPAIKPAQAAQRPSVQPTSHPPQRRNPTNSIPEKVAIANAEPGLPKYLEEPAVGKGLRLVDLTPHTCRWPFGDPLTEQFYFCGEPGADLKENRPYCPFHARKSVDRTSIRNPKAFAKSALHAAY